jgi:hypothetical protein
LNRIQVFEPALCCATGVCGEDVDQELVTFSADMEFVRSRGGDVSRYNLASEPLVFAETEAVKGFLQVVGSRGLPLVLVDGVTALTGGYPDRAQLAEWAGITSLAAGAVRTPAGATMLGLKAASSTASPSPSSSEANSCCSSPASPETEACCSGSTTATSSTSSELSRCCSKPAGSETAGCC